MALDDLLKSFSPGAGAGGGLTASPGQGLQSDVLTNAPRALTAPAAAFAVPGIPEGILHGINESAGGDVSGGGQQQGGLGDRLGGMASAGFADPTIGNIARAIGLGLSIASPMAPLGLAEGAILSQTGLPGYASNIVGALMSMAGLPGPINLSSFSGWGAIPQQLADAVQRGLITPAQYNQIVQQMQEAHQLGGVNDPRDPLGGPLSSGAIQARAGQRIGDINAVLGGPGGFFGSAGGGTGGGTQGSPGPSQGDPSGAHGTPGMGVG